MRVIYLTLLKRTAAAASCVAAIYSFLSSGFFGVLSQWLAVSFATERIPLLLGLDLGSFMKFGLLFIIGFYAVSLVSSEESTNAETLFFCLVLYAPEALSLSEVDWLNTFGLSRIATIARTPWEVLATGIIIITGYILQVSIGDMVYASSTYLQLGVEKVEVEAAFGRQLRLIALNGLVSVSVLIIIATVVSSVSPLLSSILTIIPAKHILIGVLSIILIFATIIYFISEFTKDN